MPNVIVPAALVAPGAARPGRRADWAVTELYSLHHRGLVRQAVLNRSRSVLRHRAVVAKHPEKPSPDMPSAEHGALVQLERSAVIAARRKLPGRQREAIVLRYYADFSEAEVAAAMGISCGAV